MNEKSIAYSPKSVPAGVRPLEVVGAFTPEMLEALRVLFGKLDRVDPCSPTYQKLTDYLDRLPEKHLCDIAEAGIKFASMLCANRLRVRGWKLFTVSEPGQKPVQYFAEDFVALTKRLGYTFSDMAPGYGIMTHNGVTIVASWYSPE